MRENIALNILFSRMSVFHNKEFVYGILLQGGRREQSVM